MHELEESLLVVPVWTSVGEKHMQWLNVSQARQLYFGNLGSYSSFPGLTEKIRKTEYRHTLSYWAATLLCFIDVAFFTN